MQQVMKTLTLFIASLGLLIFCCASGVSAATLTWDGQGHDNNWSTALNWTGNTVPVTGDSVIFSGTSTKDSTVNATFSATLATIAINSGYTGTITLERSLVTTSTFTQATGTFNSASFNTQWGGTFTLSSGTYTASSNIATFSGNFTHSGGIFNHNSGTVDLNGSFQTISGSNHFFNLYKVGVSNDWLTFPSGVISTVSGTLTLRGTAANNALTIRASTESVQWYLDILGNKDFYFLNVKDSGNINSTAISPTSSEMVSDLGNNSNWIISSNTKTGPQAGAIHDLASIDNWNIRFDGATSSGGFGSSITSINLDSDDERALVINSSNADFNDRVNSGSVFIISEEIMAANGESGALDLADPNNYLVRIDGASASDLFGVNVHVTDINNNGWDDLLISATGTDYNSRSASGSLYIILDGILRSLGGTGNTLDMANTNNFNLRIDGRAVNNSLGIRTVTTHDLNNSGVRDLLFNVYNYTGSNDAFYVLYNSLLQPYLGTTGTTLDLLTSTNFNLLYSPGCSAMGNLAFPDYDGDGDTDIAVTGSQTFCGSGIQRIIGGVYVINHDLFSSYSGTGNIIDLTQPGNYNFRLLGVSREGSFGQSIVSGDYDGDGKDDIASSAVNVDYNGRVNSGSLFMIYGSLLDQYAGTGNTLNLGATENSNFRWDGATAGDIYGIALASGDYDSDTRPDLLSGAYGTDYNSRSASGSLYLFKNNSFTSYNERGVIFDLANFTNFSARYDGSKASSLFGISTFLEDVNGDGRLDFISSANAENNVGRSNAGAVYVIYNFPHTVNVDSFSETNSQTPAFSGQVALSPLATTTVSQVQYLVDSSNPLGDWTDCEVSGTNYSCQIQQTLSLGSHQVFVRAADENGAYTLQSAYGSFNFLVAQGSDNPTNQYSNTFPGYAKSVTIGPNHQGPIGIEGIISYTGDPSNPGIGGMLQNTTSVNDLYINPQKLSVEELENDEIPFPWQQGFNIVTNVFDFSAVSAFNGYPITVANNPYTIILSYDPSKLAGKDPKTLKIIYWDPKSGSWKALPGPYVVNWENKTIATTTKAFSLFALGYPNLGNMSTISDQVLGSKDVSVELLSPTENKVSKTSVPSKSPTDTVAQTLPKKSCFLFWCW